MFVALNHIADMIYNLICKMLKISQLKLNIKN